MKCCICKKKFKGYGNTPAPVKEHGLCCDSCNLKIVIPARFKRVVLLALKEDLKQ